MFIYAQTNTRTRIHNVPQHYHSTDTIISISNTPQHFGNRHYCIGTVIVLYYILGSL